jgi:F-type H+-transporting ATPase subunit b
MPLLKERLTLLLILCVVVTMSGTMAAQPHQPEKPAVEQPRATHPETQPNAKGAQTQAHTTETAGEEHHEEGILPTIAKLFNFAILVGVLVYFLKSPIAAYLRSRSNDIRQDLVTAAEMRAAATAQLAEIERKLQALPAELDALKARGAEDMKAEKARIARAAGAERERLLEQTRREIDMRLRVARRELVAHAADLAVGIARERLTRSMTPDDQLRIIDRYTKQLQEAR